MATPLTTILLLSANPRNTKALRLDEERREIETGLIERSRLRDQFRLITKVAVRPRDCQRAMLDHNPQVVHFSGHGSGEPGIALEDESGNLKLVDAAALAALFELYKDTLQCVVMNACYSEVQARAIVEHIPYAIGMSDKIKDRAAIEFAVAFYDALGAGRDVEFAYRNACVAIQMAGIPQSDIPVLHRKNVSNPPTPANPSSTVPTPPMLQSQPTSTSEPLSVFISYSHRDEDFKDELVVHLANLKRQGKIRAWQDRDIEAGAEWDAEIQQQLEAAEVILLLITPRFLASDYCFDLEMQRAVERHNEGTARVIPIIVKSCDWQGTPFSKLQVVPKDAKPITKWDDPDEAFLNVVQGIRRAVESLQAKK